MEMERRISMNSTTKFSAPLIIYKISSNQAKEFANKIVNFLLDKEFVDIIFVEDTSCFDINVHIRKFDLENSHPDICIVIGGDGTVLWANHIFCNYPRPPFLTFNLGRLGYMSIYHCEDYIHVLEELYNPKKQIVFEKRCTIEANFINTEERFKPIVALNDIIIEKTIGGHMINIKILVDEEELTNIRCDGLIISTPTGSTAYNLAAGGTIVHYDVDALILNSICPQSLSFRSIAFPRTIKLKIFNGEGTHVSNVINDGIDCVAMKGDTGIEIKLSDKFLNFILLDKLIENRVAFWRRKITLQLGWNNSFKNYDKEL
jgi:NAD kinase